MNYMELLGNVPIHFLVEPQFLRNNSMNIITINRIFHSTYTFLNFNMIIKTITKLIVTKIISKQNMEIKNKH